MCQMKWAHHDLPKSVANSVESSRQRKFDEINVPFQFIEYKIMHFFTFKQNNLR